MPRTLSFLAAFFIGSVVSFAIVTSTPSLPLPEGIVGLPYPPPFSSPNPNIKFTSSNVTSGTWSGVGLPPGLTLNQQGVLSGKPSKAENFRFSISRKSKTASDSGSFFIKVIDTGNPVIGGSFTLPSGQFDQPYQAGTPNNGYKLSATGGYPFSPTQSKYPTGYYWQLIPGKTLDETLPQGMTLNANGVISGTPVWPKCPVPVARKEYKLKIRATDFLGKSSTANFILPIDPPVAPDIISDCPLPDGTELAVYPLVQLKASGGKQYYTWSIIEGEFPPGLKFNSKGYISGTPAKDARHPYTYKFKLKVTDRNCLTDEKNCEITIYPALNCNQTINLPCLYQGMVLANTTIFSASGGKPPYNWSISPVRGSVKTLPASLSQVAGDGSAISGTITENGAFSFISKVTDSLGNRCSANHTIIVYPKLEDTTICPLQSGTVDIAYSHNLTATGGKTPYTWTIVTPNTFPPGLSLNLSNGFISGTPSSIGNYTFTYTITDSCSQNITKNCTIEIIDTPSDCGTATLPGGAGVTITNHTVPSNQGEIVFSYDAYSVPDAFKVEANGIVYIDTGSISGSGSQTFCKPLGVNTVNVTVSGPTGTAWIYTLGCPTNPCGSAAPIAMINNISEKEISFALISVDESLDFISDYKNLITTNLFYICRYEITNAQYADFLNSTAQSDYNHLYNPNMANSGIQRSLRNGFHVYSVDPGLEDYPVTLVSWFDAARYANWLANGKPTGTQGPKTTEDGAYNLGSTPSARNTINPNTGEPPVFWLLNESEWYTSAYLNADGSAIWTYPTQSNTAPDSSGTNPFNFANFGGVFGETTPVGFFDQSPGPFGTFDQAGNVREWTETLDTSSGAPLRIIRGGSWADSADAMRADESHIADPTLEDDKTGFRIGGAP